MHPVLWHIGVRPIYSYSVVMGITLLTALLCLYAQTKRASQPLSELAVPLLLTGVIGGRLGHVLAQIVYYREHGAAWLDVRDGGFAWSSALLAGLALLIVLPRPADAGQRVVQRLRERISLLITPVSIGVLGGWLACWLAGCGYGLAIDPPQRFYTFDWPDSYGVLAYRLPTQALGMLLGLLLLLASRRLRTHSGWFLLLLGGGQWLIDATRGDLTMMWGPWPATQWLNLAVMALGVFLLPGRSRRHPAQASSLPSR